MLWSCDQVIINAYMVIKAIIIFFLIKHKSHEICNEQVDVMKTTKQRIIKKGVSQCWCKRT